MPKKLIKKFLPDPELIKNNKALAIFGDWIHDHNLWHLNRRCARGAFAVGAFAALMPMPFQTGLAIALAIFFRVNIPISFALCWVTNPFTMAPIFYICYNIGAFLLGKPIQDVSAQTPTFEGVHGFEFSIDWLVASAQWLVASIGAMGEAFILGSLVFAFSCSVFLFFAVDGMWRLSVMYAWKKRQQRYAKKYPPKNPS
jgi:uncharacterized protein (DUF2062 family)